MQKHAAFCLLKWIWRGKTLTRAMLNTRLLAEPLLKGVTVDLGGGGIPSYKGVLKIEGQFVNMDRIQEARPTVVGNLEATLPFATASVDNLILFNTLEHVYGYQHVINEMRRVLKTDGKVLVYVPFLFPVHTHQTDQFFVDDFFRYSQSALERFFSQAGFSKATVQPMGGIFLTIAEFVSFAIPYRILRLPVYSCCILLEWLYERLKPGVSAQRFPLAYFVVARP